MDAEPRVPYVPTGGGKALCEMGSQQELVFNLLRNNWDNRHQAKDWYAMRRPEKRRLIESILAAMEQYAADARLGRHANKVLDPPTVPVGVVDVKFAYRPLPPMEGDDENKKRFSKIGVKAILTTGNFVLWSMRHDTYSVHTMDLADKDGLTAKEQLDDEDRHGKTSSGAMQKLEFLDRFPVIADAVVLAIQQFLDDQVQEGYLDDEFFGVC
jgi:hypothetical protein